MHVVGYSDRHRIELVGMPREQFAPVGVPGRLGKFLRGEFGG
mgnify:CR=1 FL=1